MAAPTLAFVIGAQRSGTTWLHRYLDQHPQIATGLAKEGNYYAHLFRNVTDPRYQPGVASVRRPLWLRRWLAAASVLRAGARKPDPASLAGALSGDFARFFGAGAQQSVLCDVSSFYGLLDAGALSAMARDNPGSRFVLILRDPVARAWSGLLKRCDAQAIAPGSDAFLAAAQQALRDPAQLARSDYARMLKALDVALPQGRALCLFHETMFNDAEMTRLTSFLGVGARDGDFDHIVNASTAVAMPDDWAAQARVALAPSYDAVAARFGVAVPADWHAAPGIARAAQ